jgi:hypothetical protein
MVLAFECHKFLALLREVQIDVITETEYNTAPIMLDRTLGGRLVNFIISKFAPEHVMHASQKKSGL